MPARLVNGKYIIVSEEMGASENYSFQPKEDITAYELAFLLPYLVKCASNGFCRAPLFDIIPSEMHRHFVKLDMHYKQVK